jgi:hypothetical protein
MKLLHVEKKKTTKQTNKQKQTNERKHYSSIYLDAKKKGQDIQSVGE